MLPRASGVLLHPTSLPGEYGIGEIGSVAREFIDCLAATGQCFWQVLPIGPTFYAHSPYQSSSTFAGNPNLISLEDLCTPRSLGRATNVQLLHIDEIADHPPFRRRIVEFEPLVRWRDEMLDLAFDRFLAQDGEQDADYVGFCEADENQYWLDDYALFMALKEQNQLRPWNMWPRGQALYAELEIQEAKQTLRVKVIKHKFRQWLFFRQWQALKAYANSHQIEIIGDLPIYVAMDSADVWRHRNLFDLDSEGQPNAVAGVPPDYFSSTGQLWGNPLYRWGEHQSTGFVWWIERVKASLRLVDRVRIDHFRAFYNYWSVPADEPTAQNGKWVKNQEMGTALFAALQGAIPTDLGNVIIAEDLGANMTDIITWREETLKLPGMEILQFAFGNDDAERGRFTPTRKRSTAQRNNILYTGTHDNNTLLGWWCNDAGELGQRRVRAFVEQWQGQAWDGTAPQQKMVEIGMDTETNLFIIPLQDVLGLGATSRMNTPATDSGNWRWRCDHADIDFHNAAWQRLSRLTRQTERGR